MFPKIRKTSRSLSKSFCSKWYVFALAFLALRILTPPRLFYLQQSRFQQMSEQIINRIDDMGTRIDDLEKSIGDLMQQAGVEEGETATTASPK